MQNKDLADPPIDKKKLKEEQLNELYTQARASRQKFAAELNEMPKMKPTKLILLVGWSLAMAALDNSIVNIANPSIQKEPNFVPPGEIIPQNDIQWIVDLYSLAFSAMAIPASKIGDRFGVTIVHRIGVVGFMVFSLLCGISKFISYEITPWKYGGFYVLIISRFFQGLCAAFLMSNTMSLCSICVERQDIPKSMAMNSLGFAAATALGPPLGGLLTTYIGWEYCFFINLVIGTLSIVICWLYVPIVPKFKEPKLDWFGFIIILVGLLVLVLGFSFVPPERGLWQWGIALLCSGILIIVGFVFWELRHPFAILPVGILKNKKIICSLIAGLLNFSLVVTVTFQQPFCLQTIHGYTALTVGLVSLVNPVVQIIAAFVANRIYKKITSYMLKLIISLIAASLLICIGVIIRYDLVWIVLITYTDCFFISVFFVNNNSFMMQLATPDVRGMLGGCLQAFRETGYALGIAIVTAIHDLYMAFAWGNEPMPPREDEHWDEFADDYFDAYFVTTVIMSLVCVLAMMFALMSGVGDWEKDAACYPKRLRIKEEAVEEVDNVERGDQGEAAGLLKNVEKEESPAKKE